MYTLKAAYEKSCVYCNGIYRFVLAFAACPETFSQLETLDIGSLKINCLLCYVPASTIATWYSSQFVVSPA